MENKDITSFEFIFSGVLCFLLVAEYTSWKATGTFSILNSLIYWVAFVVAWFIIYEIITRLDKKFKLLGTSWALLYFLIPPILLFIIIRFVL